MAFQVASRALRGASAVAVMLAGLNAAPALAATEAARDSAAQDAAQGAAVPSPASFIRQPLSDDPAAIAARYGGDIIFEVQRDGNRVGQHVTRFEGQEGGMAVSSVMALKVKFLFITAYKFQYTSRAVWDGRGMKELRARTRDGGDTLAMSGARESDGFRWRSSDGEAFLAEGGMPYPTNHWNPAVLRQAMVLNTITGQANDVTITPAGVETVATGTGQREALRVVYSGELNTEAWYDREGRWVGLRFEGRDGSTIRYVCQQCGSDQGVEPDLDLADAIRDLKKAE
ncbi:DUF6134 family protein [Yunchengibacter salinarum]|uniref:DUF6134 family protein n=1 Tax=Yunchengibacter salinarum TaxID=3133399 RepID=UPI0035B6A954